MTPNRGILLLAVLLLAACQRGQEAAPVAADARGLGSASGPGAEPLADGSERIWSGVLPCSDCAGVDTRLVLRIDGARRRFELTETYIGGPGETRFSRSGEWIEGVHVVDGESLASYTLDPGAGAQIFVLRPDGALELLDAEGRPSAQAVDYRLQRL
ncbi:MAG: hypothetical protein A3E01_04410 [Gammaproteobacteria bacterium RIFCSPHIGHO2_12_FULL_63_22]|nr:MAG: hypothetical protein A3E01_04410 [Gammaproteobacteria bacterium RIFCSPHIGHO2_12_FULL_63_22]